eukprot:Awhi_evm1s7682
MKLRNYSRLCFAALLPQLELSTSEQLKWYVYATFTSRNFYLNGYESTLEMPMSEKLRDVLIEIWDGPDYIYNDGTDLTFR